MYLLWALSQPSWLLLLFILISLSLSIRIVYEYVFRNNDLPPMIMTILNANGYRMLPVDLVEPQLIGRQEVVCATESINLLADLQGFLVDPVDMKAGGIPVKLMVVDERPVVHAPASQQVEY